MKSFNLFSKKLYTVFCYPQCEKTLIKILVKLHNSLEGLYVAGLEDLDVSQAQKK